MTHKHLALDTLGYSSNFVRDIALRSLYFWAHYMGELPTSVRVQPATDPVTSPDMDAGSWSIPSVKRTEHGQRMGRAESRCRHRKGLYSPVGFR